MIKTEELTVKDRQFIRTYSDEGRYVVREGISYEEAIDQAEFNRTYEEGDYIVHADSGMSDDDELTDEQLALVLTGGSL